MRAASSEPAIARASSRSCGARTTSHSGVTPRATASTGSKARARSSHATIAPPAWASAATRSATVVRPDEGWPRSATVAARGSPPVPRIASSAANPVGTTRPSTSGSGVPGRAAGPGRGAWARAGCRRRAGPASSSSSSSGSGIGARASAPSTEWSSRSPPRRGAAAPQRAWRVASASETSDARAIGRPILEQMFYSVKVQMLRSPASRARRVAGRANGCVRDTDSPPGDTSVAWRCALVPQPGRWAAGSRRRATVEPPGDTTGAASGAPRAAPTLPRQRQDRDPHGDQPEARPLRQRAAAPPAARSHTPRPAPARTSSTARSATPAPPQPDRIGGERRDVARPAQDHDRAPRSASTRATDRAAAGTRPTTTAARRRAAAIDATLFPIRDPMTTGSQPWSRIGVASRSVTIANPISVSTAATTPGPTTRHAAQRPRLERDAGQHDAPPSRARPPAPAGSTAPRRGTGPRGPPSRRRTP